MTAYKYLIVKTNEGGAPHYLCNSFSGSSYTGGDWWCTGFDNYTDKDRHWAGVEDLLMGFSRWYMREEELSAYHMGNRLYAATAEFRFFRVVHPTYDYGVQLEDANVDLRPFEITEEEFINDVAASYEMKTLSKLIGGNGLCPRPEQNRVRVTVVHNVETNTWSWSSDFLSSTVFIEEEVKRDLNVPVGFNFHEGKAWISDVLECPYRFGGNDTYNRRNDKEDK